MERKTEELTLPLSGAKVVLYSYLTTGDSRKIGRVALSAVGLDLSDVEHPKPQMSNVSGVFVSDVEDVALGCLIKEIFTADGEKVVDIIGFINDLPISDGNLVYSKVNEISQGADLSHDQKKK
jgi:hypothetical protein